MPATSISPSAETGAGRLRPETVLVVLLVLGFLARLIYGLLVPLTSDELMHWQWSRHLDIGYPEHPPLIAWLLAASTSIFGHVGWAIRLVSVVAMTLTFAVTFLLGKRLYGARAALVAVVAAMVTLVFSVGGILANVDALYSLFWALFVCGMMTAVLDERRVGWLMAGVSLGLALLSKLLALLLFPATALFLLATPAGRRWLRRWEPYASALLGLAIFSPQIIWLARHDWFSFKIRLGHQVAGGFTLKYVFELVGGQLFTISPFLFVWALWGVWCCWKHRDDRRAILLGSYAIVPWLGCFVYSFFARAGLHWPAVGYVTGFIAAAVFTVTLPRPRLGRRYLLVATAFAVLQAGIVFAIPLAPNLPSFHWPTRPDKVSTDQLNNLIDWRELGAAIHAEIERQGGETVLLIRRSYGLANLAAFYTPGQPAAFLWEDMDRNGWAYNQWKEEADLRGRNAVMVSDGADGNWFEDLRCCFETLSEPRHLVIRRGRYLREFELMSGTGFKGFSNRAASTDDPEGW